MPSTASALSAKLIFPTKEIVEEYYLPIIYTACRTCYSEQLPDQIAHGHQHRELEESDGSGVVADLHQLAEGELEPEREHEKDHAQLRQRVHSSLIGDEGNRDVRADDGSGQQISEDDRLVQPLEHDRSNRRESARAKEPATSVPGKGRFDVVLDLVNDDITWLITKLARFL